MLTSSSAMQKPRPPGSDNRVHGPPAFRLTLRTLRPRVHPSRWPVPLPGHHEEPSPVLGRGWGALPDLS